jgi:Mn2+/Fe2+ NRAMP family transporter
MYLVCQQAGSYTKYQLGWVLLVSLVAGLILQAMSLRIGIFTGKHLAQLCRYDWEEDAATTHPK